ncbi:uncharacterized protein [Diabrotica undecimpunctata]|uniref:uncharacterized protein n=1 Tax=Diabrotica undecimpunctata TaxID=50387 RepID=UPI003B63AC5C
MVKIFDEAAIRFWIQQSIGTENFTFVIENTTQKGEGYIGEILFITVDLQEPNNGKCILYLVIKTNKNYGPDKNFPIVHEFCKREVFFYSKILKAFQEFQNKKNVRVPFDMIPKCYKTFLDDENQVIILQNLKKNSYALHPREKPLNIAHLKMGLRSYAKLHALSFALNDQKKDIFEKISKNCFSLFKDIMQNFRTLFDTKTPTLVEKLKEAGRPDLSIVYQKFMNEKSIFNRFMEILNTTSKDQVIIHADCHNANMLFQYKDNDTTTPLHMVLIDFQAAGLHSPIIDLSYFLYINLSSSDFPNLKDFVEYYYTELRLFLKELGSDADKLFPRSTLEQHLKTYLPSGFLLTLTFLELFYLENDETPTLIDEESNEFLGSFIKDVKIKSRGQYLNRLVALVNSFFGDPYL